MVDPIPLFQSLFPLSLSSFLGGHHAPRSATVQASLSKSDCPARTSQFLKAETWWNAGTLCKQTPKIPPESNKHMETQDSCTLPKVMITQRSWTIIQSSNMLLQQRCVYPPRSCELFTLSIAVQDSRHMCATRRHSHIEDMNAWVWRWRHEVSVLLLSYCQQLSSQNMTLHISVEISTQQYIIYFKSDQERILFWKF